MVSLVPIYAYVTYLERGLADCLAEELRSILDFADAAGEWGSVVPLPREHAARMEELEKGRRMAG